MNDQFDVVDLSASDLKGCVSTAYANDALLPTLAPLKIAQPQIVG